ncbi:hypothetical protein H6G41_22105 [Tolypothrix sp. FACHB-123]|uniref:hypothetical protein n=1 Tax=Tolypothrix sp. FACHB-123 TaxID=2692868 RepID=UPI001685165F|nr:hypothetical protein [Tolypothrix sp. FACHB-123]MBD2357280.1 hypothetical protein [Tolypothrix sp. FACHB-123]
MNQTNSVLQQEEMIVGTYNIIIRHLDIKDKEKPSQNDYIQAFKLLPDFVLKGNGILISDLNEGHLGVLLSSHRDAFKAIHKWLVYFDSANNNSFPIDPPELPFDWELDYESHAKQSWAFLNLCKEILNHDQFGWKESIKDLSAAELWFSCEFEKLENTFKITGILGESDWRGKHSDCDAMSKQIRENFDSLHSRRFADACDFQPNQIQSWDSTDEAIRVHAEKIAQQDFQFRYIYYNYINIRKQTLRSIRNNPNLQFAALGENRLLSVGGKGKRGKSRKPTKGFCKQK